MTEQERWIRMCDHPLIQDRWKPKAGDWFYTGKYKILYSEEFQHDSNYIYSSYDEMVSWKRSKVVWLPSIGQLQGMVPSVWELSCVSWSNKGGNRYKFDDLTSDAGIFYGDTAKEALIQGVMHKLHGLRWSDKEGWING